MSRALPVLLLTVVLVFAGTGLMLYLAYGLDASAPAQATVAGLGAPATVAWHENGLAVIEAADEAGAYAALGFVHGQQHASNIVLWRQTATGRLAEWFGDELLPLDRLVHRLGLPALARESYAMLPEADRELLAAYARGVNAALAAEDAAYRSAFAARDVDPGPWEPWHTLALERLFAWLASPPLSPDTLAHAGPDAVGFFEADRDLRRWLHVHGFENSMAWAVTDSAGTHFLQRHVYGATALPFFQEVSLSWPGMPRLMGATLPGTPFMTAGRTDARAWALLLYSPVALVRTAEDTTTVRPAYERIVSADGTEHLIASRRNAGAIFFDPPPRPPAPPPPPDTTAAPSDTSAAAAPGVPAAPVAVPDSTWSVQWSGFQPGSDWAAWRSLPRGDAAAFHLLSGSGLAVTPAGAVEVLGTPRIVQPLPGGLLVSNNAWTQHAAVRLDSLIRRPRPGQTPRALSDDRFSTWAAQVAPPMIEAAVSIPDQPALVAEALTYLRNWDFAYDRASIAASIFDTWVTTYRDSVGHLPPAVVADTLYYEHLLRYRLLVRAVDALAQAHGTNLSQWRWEKVMPRRYVFPGHRAGTPADAPPAGGRYAPLALPGDGHPSTLAWGPSPVRTDLVAPAHWEAWIETGAWDAVEVRRFHFEVDTFFGRYLIMDRPPAPVSLVPTAPAARTTTLVPPVRPGAPS